MSTKEKQLSHVLETLREVVGDMDNFWELYTELDELRLSALVGLTDAIKRICNQVE